MNRPAAQPGPCSVYTCTVCPVTTMFSFLTPLVAVSSHLSVTRSPDSGQDAPELRVSASIILSEAEASIIGRYCDKSDGVIRQTSEIEIWVSSIFYLVSDSLS